MESSLLAVTCCRVVRLGWRFTGACCGSRRGFTSPTIDLLNADLRCRRLVKVEVRLVGGYYVTVLLEKDAEHDRLSSARRLCQPTWPRLANSTWSSPTVTQRRLSIPTCPPAQQIASFPSLLVGGRLPRAAAANRRTAARQTDTAQGRHRRGRGAARSSPRCQDGAQPPVLARCHFRHSMVR
jgi:hypothetical protein